MKFSIPTMISEQFHTERILKDTDRGVVLLLRHRQDGTRCICKQFAGNAEVYELLRQIRSPHLPRVDAVVTGEGCVTVLEEYIGGDTLAELLSVGPLTSAQARDVTLQLCAALELLHSHGVVHRDIKPENVILRGDTAVLIDFDASRVEKSTGCRDTQIMGTAGYAAPEQYGFSQTDARSDIYALGVLMNVMLTGQHPASRLAEGPLRSVIQKCIEVNADRRYGSVIELARAVRRADTISKPRNIGKWLALAAAVCLLAGIGYLSERQPTEPRAISTPQSSAPVVEEGRVSFAMEENVRDRETVSILQNKRGDAQIVSPTNFTYDLDGDGEGEDYLFGVTIVSPLSLYGDVVIDEMIGVMPGDVPGRAVVPCVWQYQEDGSLKVAEEFRSLLENASTAVHFHENPDGTRCAVSEYHHRWPGGITIRFPADTIGTWVYTVTATLGGETLTAQGSTVVVYQ